MELPILGICAGEQLLAVISGGTLIQHIPDVKNALIDHAQKQAKHLPQHEVVVEPDSLLARIAGADRFMVNSTHHQAVQTVGHNWTITARAEDKIIEAIEKPDHSFCLGVQWHPEFLISEADHNIWQYFIGCASR
jgi:putative glutamine amidotransferase